MFYFSDLVMIISNPAIHAIASIKRIGIHNGDVTHHHDQAATCPIPASLRVKKIRKRTVPIPMPLDVDFCLSMLFVFMINLISFF